VSDCCLTPIQHLFPIYIMARTS